MKKLIIFDWNGTLLSDTLACMDADNHVIKEFGGTPVNLSTFRNTIIIPAINFYIQHGCCENKLKKYPKKLGLTFHSFYELRANKCRSRRNSKLLLRWLKKNSIKSIISSNHTIEGINSQLHRLKMIDYIAKVLANSFLDSSMKKRNKREKIRDYLANHKYKLNEVLIVGDTSEEIEIGKALGIETVAITDGYYSTKRIKQSNPDYLINNLEELIEIIKENKKK
ncbi:MAG: HAD family hydrolase [Candidatus Pacebacteria bacterium]|nr:HAD family hydrolase [Candidatus Paceibacterota bacterium]